MARVLCTCIGTFSSGNFEGATRNLVHWYSSNSASRLCMTWNVVVYCACAMHVHAAKPLISGKCTGPVAARHMRQLRPGLTCHFGKTQIIFFLRKRNQIRVSLYVSHNTNRCNTKHNTKHCVYLYTQCRYTTHQEPIRKLRLPVSASAAGPF